MSRARHGGILWGSWELGCPAELSSGQMLLGYDGTTGAPRAVRDYISRDTAHLLISARSDLRDQSPICPSRQQPSQKRKGLPGSHPEQTGTCASDLRTAAHSPKTRSCDVHLRRSRSRTPRPGMFSRTSASESRPTHLLCSLVSEQREFNGQAFQRLFEGPPRATVQSGPGGERGRVRP